VLAERFTRETPRQLTGFTQENIQPRPIQQAHKAPSTRTQDHAKIGQRAQGAQQRNYNEAKATNQKRDDQQPHNQQQVQKARGAKSRQDHIINTNIHKTRH
jgi:hypothetical protein